MKKMRRSLYKVGADDQHTEERETKIRSLKTERRDKYKTKNQRIHHFKDVEEEWDNWDDHPGERA